MLALLRLAEQFLYLAQHLLDSPPPTTQGGHFHAILICFLRSFKQMWIGFLYLFHERWVQLSVASITASATLYPFSLAHGSPWRTEGSRR